MRKNVKNALPLLAILCMVTGCVRLDNSVNYQDRKTVFIYPIVNNTDRKQIKAESFDAKQFFPQTTPNRRPFSQTGNIVNGLSDRGYTVVFGSNAERLPPWQGELDPVQQGMASRQAGEVLYDYSVVVSLDAFKAVNLAAQRQFDVALYLIDKERRVIWRARKSQKHWRGILGGPIDAVFEALGGANSSHILGAELADTISAGIMECPLFATAFK